MTIAQNIKSLHIENINGIETIKDCDSFVAECEALTDDVEQDFEMGVTTYTFDDGSSIIWSDIEVEAR